VNIHAAPWHALWFLYTRSWRNRLVEQLRRLKQPRYIIGALAMLAYLGSLLLSPRGAAATVSSTGLLDLRHVLAIAGLGVSMIAWWLATPSDSALAYSPAEIYFLFPAPVERRTLVQARLLSVQALMLMQVVIWTVLLRRSTGDLPALFRAAGLWTLFTTVSLHRLGATLARTHAPDTPRRAPIAKTLALLYLAALGIACARVMPAAIDIWRSRVAIAIDDPTQVVDRLLAVRLAVQGVLDDPVVRWLTWPIRAATTPAFAINAGVWIRALPGAIAVLIAHYLWIIRNPQPFEELALGSSARLAERVAMARQGKSTPRISLSRFSWSLATTGRPAVALVWKNVTAVVRTFRPRSLLIAIGIAVLIAVLSNRGEDGIDVESTAVRSVFITTMVSVFAGALLTGPAWFRLDLRHDLAHLPFLKTAPLAARTIVATEILTAALVLTVGMLLFFGLPVYFLLRTLGGPVGAVGLVGVILAGTVALGGINLLHITLYNAVALWLPAWVPLAQGGRAGGGASVVGQVYITLIGILITLGLLLAAPAAAAWGVVLVLAARAPLAVVITLALVVGMVLITLEWLGLARLLGRALDQLEPSDLPTGQS
jgi:ABC-2 type transport system permease protein